MAKVLRKVIEVDEEFCNGCGKCVLACQDGGDSHHRRQGKAYKRNPPFPNGWFK